jgi:hypothetical protein
MVDSRKDSRPKKGRDDSTNAVVYVNGNPCWDIAADEVAFAMKVEQKGKDFLFLPAIRQHTDAVDKKGFAYENKVAVRDSASPMKISGDDFELIPLDEKPLRAFVDTHFTRLYGVSDQDQDVMKHKKYLDEHPYLKTRIFREGVQGIGAYVSEEDEVDELDVLDISIDLSDERKIEIVQDLYSPTKNRVEEILMVHHVKEPSEKSYQTWRKASTSKFNTRKKKFITRENYDVLEQVYDGLAISIDGIE